MATHIKVAAFVLILAYGVWLAFHPEPTTGFHSSWNCAGGKFPICIQKMR